MKPEIPAGFAGEWSTAIQELHWCAQLNAPQLVQSWMDQPEYGTVVIDDQGIVQLTNLTFLSWLGLPANQVMRQRLQTLFPVEPFTALAESLQKSLAGESVTHLELGPELFPQHQASDICVNHYPLYFKARPDVAGVLICIKRAEGGQQEMGKRHRDNQLVLDSFENYLVLLDTEMRILTFNSKLARARRLPFEINRGEIWLEDAPVKVKEKYQAQVQQSLLGETLKEEIKIADRWWEIRHTPVRESGKIVGVAISGSNIDDWVRMRQEFNILTQELMSSNVELQQFAYITSHNLRAPVVNLVSLIGFMERTALGNEMNQQIFDKMEVSALRLENTLEDLVKVVAIKDRRNVSFERVRFRELLDELLETIEWDLIESQATIQVDFSQVREVLYPRHYLVSICQNLLSNAMKYRQPERRPHIVLSSFREQGYVGIQVQDNGRGIDLETYGDRLFGLYQRFHEGEGLKGKGLGLYIVKSQVDSLDGRIEIESQPQKGTTIRVYLRPVRSL